MPCLRETKTPFDLCTFHVAEWAIARLQIEGARQMTPGVHQEKPVDLESRVTPQASGRISMASLGTASKSPAVQDCSPEAVSGVSSGATSADESARVPAHGSYKCTSEKHSGRLFVTSLGVRFETNVGVRDQWQIRYDNMSRVEKVRDSDPIFYVLSLTTKLLSKDQSHCQGGLRSRYLVY